MNLSFQLFWSNGVVQVVMISNYNTIVNLFVTVDYKRIKIVFEVSVLFGLCIQ